MAVLSRFGVLERRGLDEAALDITMEVMKRSALLPKCEGFSGHVLSPECSGENVVEVSAPLCADRSSSDHYLMVGSQFVAEIRAAVEKETGFRCSSGIASNKMLAKLISSINKPNKQTCILESAVPGFLMPLHVRKLPGIGHQTESVLKDMGITTVADLQQSTLQQLSTKFGNRMGMLLFDSCRGVDKSLVQDKGPPKSLSVEDSFQPCTSFRQAEEVIRSLAPDLISRLDEDKAEFSRRPKVFTVKWRYPGNWAFKSSSAPMPLELLSACVPLEQRFEILVEIAMKLLSHSLGRQSFSIVVLNIGATSFTCSSNCSYGASHDIRSFLSNPLQSTKQMSLKVISKREARVNREQSEKGKADAKLAEPVFESFKNKFAWDNHSDLQTHGHDILELEEGDEGQPVFQSSQREDNQASMQPSTSGHVIASVTAGSFANEEPPVKASGSALSKSCGMADVAADYLLEPLVARSEKCLTASNDLFQKRLVDPNTDSWRTMVESTTVEDHEGSICEGCGQKVEGDFLSKQEHDDYHYALDLHTREQGLFKSILNPSLSPFNMPSKRKATKQALPHQSPLKKTKTQNERARIQNSTLDCFVYRSQGQ